jgi:hypothetical protein
MGLNPTARGRDQATGSPARRDGSGRRIEGGVYAAGLGGKADILAKR